MARARRARGLGARQRRAGAGAAIADLPFVSLALGLRRRRRGGRGRGADGEERRVRSRCAIAGENSIVIYLAFFLPMAATRTVLLKTGIIPDLGTIALMVTAAGVIGALALFWAVRGTPLRFLFERPAWARLEARAERRRCSRRNDSQLRCRRIDSGPLTAHIRAMPAKSKSPAAKPAAAKPRPPKPRPQVRRVGSLKKGDHVFLVDGSGYIFRAYHALPPLTRKSDGLQVNAVLGFCNMLWKLLRDMKPEERADPSRGDLRQVRRRPSATRSTPTTRRTGRTRRTTSSRNSR